MSKHKFPKDVLRFFNSPQERPDSKNSKKQHIGITVYAPRVYEVKSKAYRIPARAIIENGKKKYVPAW